MTVSTTVVVVVIVVVADAVMEIVDVVVAVAETVDVAVAVLLRLVHLQRLVQRTYIDNSLRNCGSDRNGRCCRHARGRQRSCSSRDCGRRLKASTDATNEGLGLLLDIAPLGCCQRVGLDDQTLLIIALLDDRDRVEGRRRCSGCLGIPAGM